MEKTLVLSVHGLVDFLLRRGDIDTRVFNKASMQEGSRIHAYYQKRQGASYLSEYELDETFAVEEFNIRLQGRADGIIVGPFGVIIDEIKSTVIDLKEFADSQADWHLGQAKCYALMYAHEKSLQQIGVRLTYIHQGTEERMIREYVFSTTDLERDVQTYMEDYLDFYRILFDKKSKRNESASHLDFPFSKFRPGQRELAKYSFAIATKGGTLFAEAPTGIGKTMSTLYPFARSFADGFNEKIFYLTAKSSGREAAFAASETLKKKGLQASDIVLTAKDKICFNPGAACNPDECPFARGYYNKIGAVLKECILKESTYDYETLVKYAVDNNICPFEFELDLSLFTDIIICDYNYIFDPMVYLRRYFDADASHYIALIDEAHNLVDRGRDMYSVALSSGNYDKMKKALKGLSHKKMSAANRRLNKLWKAMKETYVSDEPTIVPDIDPSLLRALDGFFTAGQDILKNHSSYATDDFLDFFFEANRFLKMSEIVDDSFKLYIEKVSAKDLVFHIYCLDPSKQLAASMAKIKGRVLFSATLTPMDYYVRVLGGKENDPALMLPSPFPKENLLLMVAPKISTKYAKRQDTFGEVAEYIAAAIENRLGNYLVFFPSYKYLNDVLAVTDLGKDVDLFAQTQDMDDDARAAFLLRFRTRPQKTTVGYAVLGGAFSEGIDLLEDRLIGAIIVGVGLPQLSFERNLIRDYHDAKGENGYEFSYVNPGMNRVMQAVGRVIRSEHDKGIILLIDDRFLQRRYRDLFKHEWSDYQVVTSQDDVRFLSEKFWDQWSK